LVVQPALASFATREDSFLSTANSPVQIPLEQNFAKVLNFTTNAPNERLKITYNAECVARAATAAQTAQPAVVTTINVDGAASSLADLCQSVDATGKTWIGAARQRWKCRCPYPAVPTCSSPRQRATSW
jgi:hypothetical protein